MVRAIDTNVFVYALDATSEFTPFARALLLSITSGKHAGIASTVAITEVMRKAPPLVLEAMQATNNLSFAPVSTEIALKAADIYAKFKLDEYDELHIATALVLGADEFWTNDEKLLKRNIPGLKMCALTSFKA